MVPYLGTYLTVLTMLDTALNDTVDVSSLFVCLYGTSVDLLSNITQVVYFSVFCSQGGLINFEKRRRVGVAS